MSRGISRPRVGASTAPESPDSRSGPPGRPITAPAFGASPSAAPGFGASPSARADGPSLVRQLRTYLIVATVVPLVAALYWSQVVLIPVALAALLTFLLAPLVSQLERMGLGRLRAGRVIAVILVVVLVFTTLGGVAWVIAHQFQALGSELPRYRGNLMRKISDVRGAGHGGLAEVETTA